MFESYWSVYIVKKGSGEESRGSLQSRASPLIKAARPRLRNHTQKVDRELFRLQDHEPPTYEIYNFNSTELDVSVSAQLAVKLIESPVPKNTTHRK
jgi:hypothetical protein